MSKDINDITKGRSSSEVRSILTMRRTPVVRRAKTEGDEKPLPPIIKASALINTPLSLPPEIVEGLLYRGSTMVYGGASKTNKTFALMDLAVSVATGSPWWDLKTTEGKVLYLDFELQPHFFRNRLDRILTAKGLLNDKDNLDVWNLRGHAADISKLTPQILERIKDTPYRMIIVDPIYKVLGRRDENSAGDVNSLMNELDSIAVASDAAIVAGHHFSKGNKSGSESKDRISGSGVFARSPDAIVTVTPHEKEDVYSIETTLRNHKRMDPFCLRWSYPLMVRCNEEDPANLKKPGLFKEKFKADDVLRSLYANPLTTREWEKAACDDLKMSPRTFASKKRELVDKKWVKEVESKWEPVFENIPGLKVLAKETQVQGATAAIAPVAA